MVVFLEEWQALREDREHINPDATTRVIPAGHIVCYQTQGNLLPDLPGITRYDESWGRGGTGKLQKFTGYFIKAIKARKVAGGILITLPDNTPVWLLEAKIYKNRKTGKLAHGSSDEALMLIDTA